MNNDQDINNVQDTEPRRLGGLDNIRTSTEQNMNVRYSKFIKRVQIALPILAILLIIIIIGWNNFEGDKIVPLKQEDIQPTMQQEIGKNELVNPKFESIDTKGQPFKLTAEKAIQENKEQSEMLLEKPSGTLKLNSGQNVTIRADNGTYRQIEETLDLNNNIILTHSQGYNLYTDFLNVDLKNNKATSQKPVRVTGPQVSIDSKGIEASSQDETVIFKGPAKMLLNIENNAIGFGAVSP